MWVLDTDDRSNYTQLGLSHSVYMSEILFNRGMCWINLGHGEKGMADLVQARISLGEETLPEIQGLQQIITEAIRDKGAGYSLLDVPVSVHLLIQLT